MDIEIYQNGAEDSCRVYFNGIPVFMVGGKFKRVFSGQIESEDSPREIGDELLKQTGLELVDYMDKGESSRFGISFKMNPEDLSALIEKHLRIKMIPSEKSL